MVSVLKFRISDILSQLFVFVIIAVLGYTAILKLADPGTFEVALMKSNILRPWASFLKWIVPISEVVAVVCLISNRLQLLGKWLAAILMVSFTAYLIVLFLTSPQTPCGCGGVFSQLTFQEHILVNVILTAMTLFTLISSQRSEINIAREPDLLLANNNTDKKEFV